MWAAVGLVTVSQQTSPINIFEQLSAVQRRKIQAYAGGPANVHAVMLQAWFSNAGKVYIGDSPAMTKAGVDLSNVLVAPGSNQPASFSMALVASPNGVGFDSIYLMVDAANDGVLVTVEVA